MGENKAHRFTIQVETFQILFMWPCVFWLIPWGHLSQQLEHHIEDKTLFITHWFIIHIVMVYYRYSAATNAQAMCLAPDLYNYGANFIKYLGI